MMMAQKNEIQETARIDALFEKVLDNILLKTNSRVRHVLNMENRY